MKTAQSGQKSYADQRRKPLEFEVGDMVFLKVSPMRGVVRFGKKGKLGPRFVGPFPIVERVGVLAYRLDFPLSMSGIHNVFHVSMLRKCLRDPEDQVPLSEVEIQEDMSVVVKPMAIVDRSEKVTRGKRIKMVKVRWSENEKDVTWELEDKIKSTHPELLTVEVSLMSCMVRSTELVSSRPFIRGNPLGILFS